MELLRHAVIFRCILLAAVQLAPAAAWPQAAAKLPPVTVTAVRSTPVEKSYRKMVHGMDYFEAQRAKLAPNATLRFKLLPRKRETDMDHIVLEVIGKTVETPVPVAPDRTFALVRDARAIQEDAVVTPNRKAQSMTWRADIRTPGLPPDTRRLGDLRLECQVGLEADLVSNSSRLIGAISSLLTNTLDYCDSKNTRYLFFADRPLFSVTMTSGARTRVLPVSMLWAEASDDPGLKYDLPYCDCEVLVDRTYFLPLGDHSWPDDTLVQFDYMDG